VGGFSPEATIHAMVCPTGMSAPRVRDSGKNAVGGGFHFEYGFIGFYFEERLAFGDPIAFLLRQAMSLPVSCAISRAGITTLSHRLLWGKGTAMAFSPKLLPLSFRAGFNHIQHVSLAELQSPEQWATAHSR